MVVSDSFGSHQNQVRFVVLARSDVKGVVLLGLPLLWRCKGKGVSHQSCTVKNPQNICDEFQWIKDETLHDAANPSYRRLSSSSVLQVLESITFLKEEALCFFCFSKC